MHLLSAGVGGVRAEHIWAIAQSKRQLVARLQRLLLQHGRRGRTPSYSGQGLLSKKGAANDRAWPPCWTRLCSAVERP